ncbi:hypothetical protein CSPB12327_00080 [Campylobacter sp. RM12327]|uniref:hypothetical protein n=1 Tax=Campylobacter sputorum TaxID=206 RepID=UPI000B770D8A|nr:MULTISPECIES: hypothetical protein [Campylobacter]ASM40475.1 hypothetical protein CSPB_1283 [Campylobacter sputorum]MBE7357250.1 hypothetical protein [Campylobacter sp. RM11302]MBF6668560.1 hypothetical protein [Campylobacter sp. RM12327]MBF6674185.1 hypothetical protein [Campylobacter sp. RM13538]MBF6675654.1 hypothetical protein [Campylobacter sp. RM12321]
MKKIVISVNSRDYTITLEDEFAVAFERDMQIFLDGKKTFSVKDLLTAFVQKCQENYFQDKELKELIKNISDELKHDEDYK